MKYALREPIVAPIAGKSIDIADGNWRANVNARYITISIRSPDPSRQSEIVTLERRNLAFVADALVNVLEAVAGIPDDMLAEVDECG